MIEQQGSHVHTFSLPTLSNYCDVCGKRFPHTADGQICEGDIWLVTCKSEPPRFSLERGRVIITYACHKECAAYLDENLPDKVAELFSQWTNTEW
jgi:hypothetical protein